MPLCNADEECEREAKFSNGLCSKHNNMRLRHGRTYKIIERLGYWITEDGYIRYWKNGKMTYEHIDIAEKALGHPLPKDAVVHHVNLIPHDNRPENLVICPGREYHNLIHMCMRELGYTK